MLQSNKPYQRVDDGIGAGLVGGAVLGGMAHYATGTTQGYRMINAGAKKLGMSKEDYQQRVLDRGTSRAEAYARAKGDKAGFFGASGAYAEGVTKEVFRNTPEGKFRLTQKAYGSDKRRLISGGLSALGGSILGASIDAAND